MIGKLFALIMYMALANARAIVTNNCPHNVYIWSIPVLGLSHTDNVSIKPGGQYQEPWRQGSPETPGIAIKVSSQADGILKLADEIDFAYSIDYQDNSKIWVDLSPVRGDALHHGLSFHSCLSSFNTADVPTHVCHATDEVELVLCGATRSSTTTVTTPLEQVQACYDPDSSDSSDSDDEAECRGSYQAALAGADSDNTKKSNCPMCDRLPTMHQCQTKVVYPARRAGRMPSSRMPPGPAITQRKSHTTLCDIVRKYHPGIEGCDEEHMKAYTRTLYPRICDAEYEALLMGFPCEEIAKEIKAVYSGVTNTTTALRVDYEGGCSCGDNWEECRCSEAMEMRQDLRATSNSTADTYGGLNNRFCLFDVCEPAIPGVDCTVVAHVLESIVGLLGGRYTDWMTEDCEPLAALAIDGLPVVCINKLCALQPGTACEDLQSLLQSAVKTQLKRDIVFTVDGTICGK